MTTAQPVLLPITTVQVFPISNPKGKLLAFARILIADQLLLTSLRVYQGSQGLFVSYPNDPMHTGEDYRQVFYPTTREFRELVEKTVLDEYERATKGQQ